MSKDTIIFVIICVLFVAAFLVPIQSRVSNFGDSMTVYLEPNQKLEQVSWKYTSLWYLTKPMSESDVPEVYTYYQNSSWGVFEGTVTIIETRFNDAQMKDYLNSNLSIEDYLTNGK